MNSAITKKILLLVEDEAIIAMAQKVALEKYEYDVITVLSGEKAVGICKENINIDLILMDIDLGESIDGTETAKIILKDRDIPIVFLSSHTSTDVVGKTEKITSYGYVVKNSSIAVLDASIKMALKLFEAKNIIKESQEKYKIVFDKSPIAIEWYNSMGELVDTNDECLKLFGIVNKSEIFKFKLFDDPNISNEIKSKLLNKESIRFKANFDFEKVKELSLYQTTCSGIKFLDFFIAPILKNNSLMGYILQLQDITNQKIVEQALIEAKQKYASLIENTDYMVVRFDIRLRYVFINPAVEVDFGIKINTLLGKTPHETAMLKEDAEFIENALKKVVETRRPVEIEQTVHQRVFQTRIIPEYDKNRDIVSLLAITHDITENKLAEDKIKSLLKEKELILKEVHHRIKNNMSTISGILNMQIDTLTDPISIDILKESESRIQSMMLLYDKLYQSPTFKTMKINEYFSFLIDEIIINFSMPTQTIEIKKVIEDITLDTKQIQVFGIILNELLTNIMKYSIINQNGSIFISITLDSVTHEVTLIIKDSGIKVPISIDFNVTPGFGFFLINSLVTQLAGTINRDKADRNTIILRFKAEP